MTSSNDPTRPADGERTERPAGAAQHADEPAAQRPSAPGSGTPAGRRSGAEPTRTDPAPPADSSELDPVEAGASRSAGLWISLILGAIVLVLLLIFVIQNNVTAGFRYFSAEFDLPLGVAMLFAAIAGALVMALVGSVAMIRMRWTIRKLRKQQEKVRRASR
ncbi:LapA family protein [Brachybacterium saurashtrense]|uniref:DUF1049 domain-containing protein n=1 Tax=Brachybacterium saurashtrense TaxID=556288 RepID=A0A345YKD8_9MICO|nr:lipopolysaccharide assembly protein LapA domain-containing protein [Brachybacterium saurashtrense]AXK44390.1 DUF1049 domain-containing protein [Brachybacterium saurashtrense]RRR23001.1 DUF1049 domain-containing protein [Brachybacterium saurashtrense]